MNTSNPHPSPDSTPEGEEARLTAWWHEFKLRIPSNAAGWVELFQRSHAMGFLECRYCLGKDLKLLPGQRMFICKTCNTSSSVTARGIFHRAREIRAWLAVLSAFECGIHLSSLRLSNLTDIAQSSALNILRKFRMVIQNNLPPDAAEIPSALLWSLFGKRSKETPARRHPVSEQEEIDRHAGSTITKTEVEGTINNSPPEDKEAANLINSKTEQFDSTEETLVYASLSHGPLPFDLICQNTMLTPQQVACALTYLELKQLAISQPGDRYAQQEPRTVSPNKNSRSHIHNQNNIAGQKNLTAAMMKAVHAIDTAIRGIHHRVSRKFIQPYLAEKSYFQRMVMHNGLSLFEACLSSAPISYAELLNYVSPAVIKMQSSD